MAMLERVESQNPTRRHRRADRIQKIRVQMESLSGDEYPAAGPHRPDTNVISEHDGVEEIGTRRALSLGDRHRGMNDGRTGMPASDMGPVDFFAMPRRTVSQCGIRCRRSQPRPQDAGPLWTAELHRV